MRRYAGVTSLAAHERETAEVTASIDRNTAAAQVRVRLLKRVPELRAGMRAEFAFQ